MTKMEEAITVAAREMSRSARVELCHMLMRDLNDAEQQAVDDAWAIEINRRIKEIDAGEELLDGDDVMREARARIRK